MKISKIEIEMRTLIGVLIILALLITGVVFWSWAIFVGFVLGLVCGLLVAFREMEEESLVVDAYLDKLENEE